jgi:hypothetical protein
VAEFIVASQPEYLTSSLMDCNYEDGENTLSVPHLYYENGEIRNEQ